MKKYLIIKIIGGIVTFIIFIFAIGIIDSLFIKDKVPVSLPFIQLPHNGQVGMIQVKGTWVIEEDSDYYRLQTSTIECYKITMECITAQAYVSPDAAAKLDVDIYISPVIEWTANHLVYKDTSSMCAEYLYTLDWATKSATGKRIKNPRMVNNDLCKDLKNELRLTLKDGFKVWQEEKQNAEPKILKLILDTVFFPFRN